MAAFASRNRAVQAELDKLAAEFPDRDFWHVPVYSGPASWCSKPASAPTSDIVRTSPQELRADLEETRDPEAVPALRRRDRDST